ncbi:hypothetical protein ACFL0V_02850 [Nanoarchaeota archaeon]
MKKEDFDSRLSRVKGKINGLDKRPAPNHVLSMVLLLVVGVGAGLFLLYGAQYTGFVVFAEDEITNTDEMFFVKDSKVMELSIPGSAQSLLLSGEVFGEGKVEVYLLNGGEKKLVYYFEGYAKEGQEFKDMCYDTCHTSVSEGAKLEFRLIGTSVRIDNIKFVASKIIDFELEPDEVVLKYADEKAPTIPVKLVNNRKQEFDVYLYIEGPLSDAFSWQGSLVHMSPQDLEKEILVRVRLPEGLVAGDYVHTLSARYVPPSDREFVGSSPVDEIKIIVRN